MEENRWRDEDSGKSRISKKMEKNQKTAVIILSFFSVFVVIIWVFNFKHNLANPFDYSKGLLAGNSQQQICTDGSCYKDENLNSSNLELKLVDTDSDGISDWDELFIYGTSPYLEDTDGDDLTDYEEIFTYRTNPLCPEGQNCSDSLYQGDSQNVSSGSSDDLYNLLAEIGTTSTQINQTDLSEDLQADKINPEMLREMLLQGGLSQNDLDQLSDDDLMKIYQETLEGF
ncbi:MAG: hypothetical protein WC928_01600 [Patescibacteria group bacterium]|jgi:hypothetical protein